MLGSIFAGDEEWSYSHYNFVPVMNVYTARGMPLLILRLSSTFPLDIYLMCFSVLIM